MKTIIDIHTHGKSPKEYAINNISPEEYKAGNNCLFSVGIHPWNVTEINNHSKTLLWEIADKNDVIAIGETGIDRLYPESIGLQTEMFEEHTNVAQHFNKPLIIHNVKATEQIVALKKRLKPTVPWIMHGFRGKSQQAIQLLNQGFMLSIGERFNEEAIKVIPLSALLIESDESKMPIETIYQRIAKVRNMEFEELKNGIIENIRKVFRVESL